MHYSLNGNPGPLGCADLHCPSALAYNGLLRFNSG